MATQAVHLLVQGYVQGVGYRAWTVRVARQLSLSGWVRNLHDGRVEVWAEGEVAALDSLADRCRRGPASAEVERVDRREVEVRGYAGFDQASTRGAPEI